MQFSSYQTEGFYDEMFQEDGAARPHFQLVQEIIQSLSDGQLLRYKHAAERLLLQLGHHLQRLRRHGRHGADLPLRPDPAHRPGVRMGPHRTRPQAAHPRAQRLHRRYLSRPEDPQGRRHSGRSRHLRRLLPQAVPWSESPVGRLVPRHRHGPGARPRRRILRPGGQSARALRRLLRAGESRGAEAHFPRRVRGPLGAPGQRLSEPPAGNAGEPGPAPQRARRAWWCSRPASTTRPTSSTASWPSRWAYNWWRAATWWSPAAMSSRAPPKAWSAWT